MPWCDDCRAYRAPSAVRRDGSCPTCGARVDPGGLATASGKAGAAGGAPGTGTRPEGASRTAEREEVAPPVPWHLKVLGAATAAYLGLRAWQGVELLIDKLG